MRGQAGELGTAPPQRAPAESGAPVSPRPPALRLPPSSLLLLLPAPPPSLLAASPVRIYCKCELLKRSPTPAEGRNLETAAVSVA